MKIKFRETQLGNKRLGVLSTIGSESKTLRKQEYFFAILSSCDSRILKLGTPVACRVVKSSREGKPDIFHVGTENTENFLIVRKPTFSKMIRAGKAEALGSKWKAFLEDALKVSKLKFTSQ